MKLKIQLVIAVLMLSVCVNPSRAQLQCSMSGYSSPTGIVYDGSTQTFWVAVFGGNYLAKLNLSCHELARYTVGRGPFGLLDDGLNIWVTNYDDNTVSKVQMSTGTAGWPGFGFWNLGLGLAFFSTGDARVEPSAESCQFQVDPLEKSSKIVP